MFPSKFLQFPSILTHFHAANEKNQDGGRDLAISRGLVWVNNFTGIIDIHTGDSAKTADIAVVKYYYK